MTAYPITSLQTSLNAQNALIRQILEWHTSGGDTTFADWGGAASPDYTVFDSLAGITKTIDAIANLMTATIPDDFDD